MDIENGLREQRRDAQLHKLLVRGPLRRAGDRVQYDALLQLGVSDPLVPGPRQEPVGRKREDPPCPLRHEDVCRLTQRSGRVNHVVHDDAVAVLDVPHEVHLVDAPRPRALLDDHGDPDVLPAVLVRQSLLEFLRAVDAPGVGTDDDGVVKVLPAEVVDAHDAPVEVVHGNARSEESLDLPAVQVYGDDAVDSHGLEEAGDVRGRDGDAGLHLPVLPSVAVVGDDDRDATGRRAVEAGDHEQELHDVVVNGRTRGLDDVHVLPPDVLVDHDVYLAVSEAGDGGAAEIDAEELGDLEGESHVAVAAEQLEASAVLLRLEGGGLEAGLVGSHGGGGLSVGIGGGCGSGGDGGRTRGVDGRHGLLLDLSRRLLRPRRDDVFYRLQHNVRHRMFREPLFQLHPHRILAVDPVGGLGISHGPHSFALGDSGGGRRETGRGGGCHHGREKGGVCMIGSTLSEGLSR
mmetsp:Transcript_57162/g.121363  ORF Transcript_57162/g.121363 Transcript_57162/m.121363 type:complete len:460 (+) Transcript_57162:591-1970(+)